MAYAWIIEKDYLENIAPIIGPSNISTKLQAGLIFAIAKNQGQKFKMYDDDGDLYYSGRIIGDYSGFEPLDDYGTASGCTDIKLFNSKTNLWESV